MQYSISPLRLLLPTVVVLLASTVRPARAQSANNFLITYSGTSYIAHAKADTITFSVVSGSISLRPAVPFEDAIGSDKFVVGSTPFVGVVSGTATYALTVNGVTNTIVQNYQDDISLASDTLTVFPSAPVTYDFGVQGTVTVNILSGMSQPISGYPPEYVTMAGRFLFTPAAVPEPGSVALLVGVVLTGAGFLARRTRCQ